MQADTGVIQHDRTGVGPGPHLHRHLAMDGNQKLVAADVGVLASASPGWYVAYQEDAFYPEREGGTQFGHVQRTPWLVHRGQVHQRHPARKAATHRSGLPILDRSFRLALAHTVSAHHPASVRVAAATRR